MGNFVSGLAAIVFASSLHNSTLYTTSSQIRPLFISCTTLLIAQNILTTCLWSIWSPSLSSSDSFDSIDRALYLAHRASSCLWSETEVLLLMGYTNHHRVWHDIHHQYTSVSWVYVNKFHRHIYHQPAGMLNIASWPYEALTHLQLIPITGITFNLIIIQTHHILLEYILLYASDSFPQLSTVLFPTAVSNSISEEVYSWYSIDWVAKTWTNLQTVKFAALLMYELPFDMYWHHTFILVSENLNISEGLSIEK